MNRTSHLAFVFLCGSSVSAFACSDVSSTPSGTFGTGGGAARGGATTGGAVVGSGGPGTLPASGGLSAGGGPSTGSSGASGSAGANNLGGATASGGANPVGGQGGASFGKGGVGGLAGGAPATGGMASGGTAGAPANGGSAPANGGSAGAGKGGSTSGGTVGTGKGGTPGATTGGTVGSGKGGTLSAGGSPSGGTAGTSSGGQPSNDRCNVAIYNASTPPKALTLTGNLGTHDPVVIFAHSQYYLFHTANGVGAKTSANLSAWQAAPAVFGSNPAWIAQQVPGATNLWAPDISYFGGSYHLYYSASTFGSNRSCIGHASRAALNAGSWTDHGSVVCSATSDNWNAIDPNVIVDQAGTPWLSFGSFWGGLKLVQLNASGARADTTLHSIAARPSAGGALEAPFIVRRCGYYYLFASFDTCCQGASSTYKIMVGRSASVTGPYVDKQGTAMMQGGGTLLVQGDARWKGPGHNAVIFTDTGAFNVYHSYDADNNGNAVLRISELAWDADGWPISGGP